MKTKVYKGVSIFVWISMGVLVNGGKKRISITVDSQLYERFKGYCEGHGMKMSSKIEQMMKTAVKNKTLTTYISCRIKTLAIIFNRYCQHLSAKLYNNIDQVHGEWVHRIIECFPCEPGKIPSRLSFILLFFNK